MKFKAVIFDMDGVLIDSELHWIRSEMAFLSKYNVELTKELNARLTGKGLRETVELIKNEYDIDATIEELMIEKKQHSDSIYEFEAQPMPGVEELFKALKKAEITIALASGSSLERIEKIMQRFNWKKYFKELVSTDQVDNAGKPNPAIYLYTAQKIGINPVDCVVIEDSVNGVRSAKAAGMSCVAVPDERWSWGDFSGADLIATSLVDTKLYVFLGLSK